MKQELYCHECGKYVQFEVPEVDGNLIVHCPNCNHEHLRVVRNGIITEDRWGSRNQPLVYAFNVTVTMNSSYILSANATSGTSTNNVYLTWAT